MTLRESKGNMYEFITHTWNPIKGKCEHDCSYCYMKKWDSTPDPIHLVESELTGKFPINTFIFVDSSADLFAEDVYDEWIKRVLDFCLEATRDYATTNRPRFLIQTKNPARILDYVSHPLLAPDRRQTVICTTIETNRHYPAVMNNAPLPQHRAEAMAKIAACGIPTFVTVEPIMDFDLDEMVALVKMCKPRQVNIGANSYRAVSIPEPASGSKLIDLIINLLCFTKVKVKKNMKGAEVTRLLIKRLKNTYSYEKED